MASSSNVKYYTPETQIEGISMPSNVVAKKNNKDELSYFQPVIKKEEEKEDMSDIEMIETDPDESLHNTILDGEEKQESFVQEDIIEQQEEEEIASSQQIKDNYSHMKINEHYTTEDIVEVDNNQHPRLKNDGNKKFRPNSA